MNKLSHQENETANLQHITSNTGTIFPNPSLWFHLSWVYLIIMPLIMSTLRFTLQIFQLNPTINLFRIHTPLQSNKSTIMKWTIYCNYSTHSTMMIFWMLNSRLFSLNWWSLLRKNVTQYLLFYFIKTEERILQSQISCHTFQCLSQPRPL